uniref:Glycoside hydrolase 131 catalytic N-terminal domain-containing protein n=1 Tax=Hyaloperonospora arabidopsidis (strain Emoy2) TaxID=559515 RepID=M4BRA7_HYAAE
MLALGYIAAPTVADIQVQKLPWDGRAFDLTVATLEEKYKTHILTMRNHSNGRPSDYVTVKQKGRTPAYNGDTGIITIGVDKDAIFKAQTNFCRSELVQNVSANKEGTTFFRTSMMKEEAFRNPYAWQAIFPESHLFEIRVDASKSPAKLIYLNNGTWDAKWETDFVPGTWYNFGIAIKATSSRKGTEVKFYTSEGDKDLVLKTTHEFSIELPSWYEFHIGLLTLSDDGSAPKMDAKQDIMSFNGVSVESKVKRGAKSSFDAHEDDVVQTKNGYITFKKAHFMLSDLCSCAATFADHLMHILRIFWKGKVKRTGPERVIVPAIYPAY